jgi:hypothetical protein
MVLYDNECNPLFTEKEACSLNHYGDLPDSAKQALLLWIKLACKPAKTPEKHKSVYSIKNQFKHDCFYVTTGQMAGAFKASGYQVTLPPKGGNWEVYCRPIAKQHSGVYCLGNLPEELKILNRRATETLWPSGKAWSSREDND